MIKKILKIFVIILAVIIILMILFFVWTRNKINKGDLIKWDNKWYTKEELGEAFPSQEYDVPAKNTPEEVYAKFRQALLDNNIETALGYMSDYRKEEYKNAFNDKEKLKKYKEIPEINKIKKSEKNSYNNFSNYFYYKDIKETDNDIPFEINFIKNIEGYWQIDFI